MGRHRPQVCERWRAITRKLFLRFRPFAYARAPITRNDRRATLPLAADRFAPLWGRDWPINRPNDAELVLELAVAVAPEHVLYRHDRGHARLDGAVEPEIGIVHLQHQAERGGRDLGM